MDAQEAMQVAKLYAAALENQIAELKARMAEQAELTQLGPAAVAALEAQVRDADSGAKAQAAENSRLEIKLARSRRKVKEVKRKVAELERELSLSLGKVKAAKAARKELKAQLKAVDTVRPESKAELEADILVRETPPRERALQLEVYRLEALRKTSWPIYEQEVIPETPPRGWLSQNDGLSASRVGDEPSALSAASRNQSSESVAGAWEKAELEDRVRSLKESEARYKALAEERALVIGRLNAWAVKAEANLDQFRAREQHQTKEMKIQFDRVSSAFEELHVWCDARMESEVQLKALLEEQTAEADKQAVRAAEAEVNLLAPPRSTDVTYVVEDKPDDVTSPSAHSRREESETTNITSPSESGAPPSPNWPYRDGQNLKEINDVMAKLKAVEGRASRSEAELGAVKKARLEAAAKSATLLQAAKTEADLANGKLNELKAGRGGEPQEGYVVPIGSVARILAGVYCDRESAFHRDWYSDQGKFGQRIEGLPGLIRVQYEGFKLLVAQAEQNVRRETIHGVFHEESALVPGKKAKRPVTEDAFEPETPKTKRPAVEGDSNSSLNEFGLVDTQISMSPGVAGPKRSVGEAALDSGTYKPKRRPAEEESDDTVDLTLSSKFCVCLKDKGGPMVQCFTKGCPNGNWFHQECVNLKRIPIGQWRCPKCRRVKARQV